jgi:diacylglycerol O-acyltransferase/trehalose O-mycolyltransferase
VGLAGCNSAEEAGPADQRAQVVDVRVLGPRLRDLTVDSPALGRSAKVRLLLPRRYRADPQRRWAGW